MNWLLSIKDYLEVLSQVILLLGVPVGLYQYFQATKKEQLDREYGTYNALDEKYMDFEKFCFAHPELDIFDVPDSVATSLTAFQKKQELIAFTMLFSIFERAYLMYSDQSTEIKRRQWTGWDEYIEDFWARENFRDAWKISGTTFDTNFEKYMNDKMKELHQ